MILPIETRVFHIPYQFYLYISYNFSTLSIDSETALIWFSTSKWIFFKKLKITILLKLIKILTEYSKM